MAEISSRIEDYLESLFQLEISGQKSTVTALAKDLKLTKGTVATIVKKMTELGLAEHESYGNIHLTPTGRKIGWQVFMKHKKLTSFFHHFLGIDFDNAEDISCLIEHHLDGRTANRFFNLIDYLTEAKENEEPWMKNLTAALEQADSRPIPLTLFTEKSGTVNRLPRDEEWKSFFLELGLSIGTKIDSIVHDEKNDVFLFKANGKEITLPFKTAALLWLEE